MFELSDIEAYLKQALAMYPELGADGHESVHPRLLTWARLLVEWNARIDLTAARSSAELVDLLVADAAHVAIYAAPDARWVDVGTGAGAPGLALGLLRPDVSVTLVEPLQKRVAFLRTVLGHLRATNLTVVHGRGEDVVTQGQRFDGAVSRATLPPADWLDLGQRLAPHGMVVVLLARGDAPSSTTRTLVREERYTWPLTHAPRRALWWT